MSNDNNFEINNYEEAVTIMETNKDIKSWNLVGEPGTGKSTKFLFYLAARGKTVFCAMPTKMGIYSASEYLQSDKFVTSKTDVKESIGTAVDSKKNYNNVMLAQIMEYFGFLNDEDLIDTKLVYCINGHFRKVMKYIFLYLKDNRLSSAKFCDYIVLDEYHLNTQDQFMIMMYWSILRNYIRDVPKLILMSATGESNKNTIRYVQNFTGVSRKIAYLEDFEDELDHLNINKINQTINSVTKSMPHIIDMMCSFIAKVFKQKKLKLECTMLVFLPGLSTMKKVQNDLELFLDRNDDVKEYEIYTAHSTMSNEYLKEILKKQKKEFKIVLSTTICETSLTIEGVNVVISSMYKRDLFEGDEGTTILKTVKISKKSAIQQAGRTGRDKPGVVLRLMKNEREFRDKLIEDDSKQMDRLPILKEVLEVISTNLDTGLFFSSLKDQTKVTRAKEELLRLKCLEYNEVYRITDCGRIVSLIPLSIRSSIIIYKGFERAKTSKHRNYNIYPDIVLAVALDFYQAILSPNDNKTSTYPLSVILYPYVKLHHIYNRIKPRSKDIERFCSKENLAVDAFTESLSRMKEIYNYIEVLDEEAGFQINREISDFYPSLVFKRLLAYAEEIFPKLTQDMRDVFVCEGTKYCLDSKLVEDNFDILKYQDEVEFYSLSSYRRPDSRRNDPIYSKIYIPTQYRDMTEKESKSFFDYVKDEDEEDEEEEPQENGEQAEEDDDSIDIEALLLSEVDTKPKKK